MFRKYGGTNVNFVEHAADGEWKVRTYCRSSESELSVCGSGSVSVAVVCEHIKSAKDAFAFDGNSSEMCKMRVKYPGGTVKVQFNVDFQKDIFSDINLTLTAFFVLDAAIEVWTQENSEYKFSAVIYSLVFRNTSKESIIFNTWFHRKRDFFSDQSRPSAVNKVGMN